MKSSGRTPSVIQKLTTTKTMAISIFQSLIVDWI